MRRKGRRIVILVAVIFMLLVFSLGAFAFQNEPEGFGGLKWGDPVREDMELLVEHKGFLIYFCPDKVVIGKSFTSYIFWEERFAGVIITFKGEGAYELLKETCRKAYGEWYDVEKELNEGFLNYKLRWTGQKSFVDLWYDTQHEQGRWGIWSTVITQEKLVAEKKEEKSRYGEDIPPEVLELIPDRVWKMIGEAKKKEAEPSELREQINKLKEGGIDIIKMMETMLLQSTLDYIMWNPHDFLFIHWEWDWIGLFHVNHELPEYLIGKTEGKLVIQIFDSRNVFADISEVALLEQFKKELVRIYNCAPRGYFSKMDRDVIALLYDSEGTPLSFFHGGEYRSPLGYLYEGEYHLWKEQE